MEKLIECIFLQVMLIQCITFQNNSPHVCSEVQVKNSNGVLKLSYGTKLLRNCINDVKKKTAYQLNSTILFHNATNYALH